MLATVNKLIASKTSAAEIQRQTGVVDATIKKIRLNTLDMSRMKYFNLKKLYDYQMSLEEEKITGYTYNDFQQKYQDLNELDDADEKYKQLVELNDQLSVRLRELVNGSIDNESDLEVINSYLDLLTKQENLK